MSNQQITCSTKCPLQNDEDTASSMAESKLYIPSAKKQMTCLTECPDRISELPDAILHAILGRLPVGRAMRTSAVSRRWKNLWASMPNLSFSYPYSSAPDKYTFFVDRVLLLREPLDLHLFSITWEYNIDGDQLGQVGSWIRYALKYNVRELIVNLDYKYGFDLPSSIFRCQSLEVLRLHVWEGSLQIVHTDGLNNLTEIFLSYIYFDADSFAAFISRCPVLETMHLENCYCSENLKISAGKLRSLTIIRCSKNICFHAPSLKSFTFSGQNDVDFHDLCSLFDATLDIEPGWNSNNVTGLLRGVRNVVDLTLSKNTTRSLSKRPLLSILPKLPNLKKLKLEMELRKDVFQAVSCLLRSTPNLETLSIENHESTCYIKNKEERWEPQGLLSDLRHLKAVEITCFRDTANENEFIKFLKASVVTLKNVVVHPVIDV